jgi:hypothetical protein
MVAGFGDRAALLSLRRVRTNFRNLRAAWVRLQGAFDTVRSSVVRMGVGACLVAIHLTNASALTREDVARLAWCAPNLSSLKGAIPEDRLMDGSLLQLANLTALDVCDIWSSISICNQGMHDLVPCTLPGLRRLRLNGHLCASCDLVSAVLGGGVLGSGPQLEDLSIGTMWNQQVVLDYCVRCSSLRAVELVYSRGLDWSAFVDKLRCPGVLSRVLLRVGSSNGLGSLGFPLIDIGALKLLEKASFSVLELDLVNSRLTFLELRLAQCWSGTADELALARAQRIRKVQALNEVDTAFLIPADELLIRGRAGSELDVVTLSRVEARSLEVQRLKVEFDFSAWDASCPLRELTVGEGCLVGFSPPNVKVKVNVKVNKLLQ